MDIYPELKKCFYKEKSNVTLEDFLPSKCGLWIDTRSVPQGNSILLTEGRVAHPLEWI